MNLQSKLAILADAAKVRRILRIERRCPRNSVGGRGMGSTEGMGICHSYAPDGRCISLLKILLTNFCQYDCLYCVNRVTSNVPRARFTVDEVGAHAGLLPPQLHRGAVLSSGIIQSPDYTMEQVVEVARVLREEHDFRGYIHLKTIPDASPELMQRAGPLCTACPSTSSCPRPSPSRPWRPRKTAPPSTDPWPAWRCTLANRARRARSKPRRPSCRCRSRAPRAGPARRCLRRAGKARR